jgi:hypothetical protein
MQKGTTKLASFAKFWATDRRNAGKESIPTNPGLIPIDDVFGPKSTQWISRHLLQMPTDKLKQFFRQSLMEPLHQAPAIIPQLIMSLCTFSIATCNKLCEIMTLFMGTYSIKDLRNNQHQKLTTSFSIQEDQLPA